MAEVDRKKPFSSLEKELFLNIIQRYDAILTCKQTNATSLLKKKQSWEKIAQEFNDSSIVSQKASTKQLTKLWYNMKAKARESKTKENVRYLTGGGPSVIEMDPIDTKVMDIDKNILTNIDVDIDSDIDGSVIVSGDTNEQAWLKIPEEETSSSIFTYVGEDHKRKRKILAETHNEPTEKPMKETEFKTPIKRSFGSNKIDNLKCQILEEELEFKKRLHEEELKIKILEREHKENLFKIELEIKLKDLDK